MSDIANEGTLTSARLRDRPSGERGGKAFWRAAVPVVYGLLAGGVLLLVMGKNPVAFYWTTLESGLLTWAGLEQTLIRLAPLLLMSAGFIVAFQAGLWNIGGDGQFLHGRRDGGRPGLCDDGRDALLAGPHPAVHHRLRGRRRLDGRARRSSRPTTA